MGRPKGAGAIKIDPAEIIKWAKCGATQAEIALRLGVSDSTLERRLREPRYREALGAGRGELLISLRAKQVQVALAGNTQMLKWLGEQYLGQSRAQRFVDQEGKDRDLNVPASEILARRIDSLAARVGAPEDPQRPD